MFDNNKKIVLSVCILFGAYLIDYLFIHTGENTVLEFKHGRIKGKISVSRGGKEFYEFLGVPYAQPPLGKLRFLSPKASKPWTGTLDATKYQSKCMQVDFVTNVKSGSEDCLYLNVFSPKTTGVPSLYPVLVYFHGGYFMMGDAKMFGPKYFMDENVVLVTVNYRLGSLGFLNAGNKYARGNQGLKDQVESLRWIQENIAHFNGDPNSVTIFGHSAGAASAHLHMFSKMSKGLFHKVISASGTALSPMTFQRNPIEQAKRLGRGLRCPSNRKTEAMVACLGQSEVQRLVESQRKIRHFLYDPIRAFKPTIETIDDEEAFLTKDPVEMLKKGEIINNVPWIVGVTADEGAVSSASLTRNSSMMRAFEKDWEDSLQKTLQLQYATDDSSIPQKIKDFYFGKSEEPFVTHANAGQFTKMFTDRTYSTSVHNSVVHHGKNAPVFLYYFNQPSPLSYAEIVYNQNGLLPPVIEIGSYLAYKWVVSFFRGTPAEKPVAHFDDQTFFFNMPFLPEYPQGNEHYEFSRDLVKLWVSFAKSGSPSEFKGVPWRPVQADAESPLKFFEISKSPKIISEPFFDAVKFWNSLNLKT